MCLLCVAATGAASASLAAARQASSAPLSRAALGAQKHLVAAFVNPVLVSAFGYQVYNYGFFVAMALLIAFLYFALEKTRAKLPLNQVIVFWVFLFGFAVGSKGHIILQQLFAGQRLTWASFNLKSGHSFIGSQIGAVLSMFVYIAYCRVGVLQLLDVLLPCCLLGHTIGKLGCFFSGDGCYGPPSDQPWAMSFPNGGVPTWEPVHPTPLYEAVLSFSVFASSLRFFPMPQPSVRTGRRTAYVLVLYGIERASVEPFRRHPPIELFGGLTEYQVFALAFLFIGAVLELLVRRKERRAAGEKVKAA